jgi:hypothetical protein
MGVKNWKEFIKDIPTEVLEAELLRREEDARNELNLDPLALEIMQATDKAITQFGEYTFGDKGPHEVMNISVFSEILKGKPVKEVASILSQVLDNGNYRHASSVVDAIIGELDSMPEDWFEELLDSDDRFEY